ncbi:MAG TPA: PQQ-binding-like beta-propeller repeat protein [Gemmatimonadaceae bacterium]
MLSFAALTCNGATEPGQGGRVIWQVAGTGWSITPSHDSSRVFFGTMDHRIIAFDRETGNQLWEASTGVGPGGATAGTNTLVVGDVVVIGDVDIYAFDRATGERRWVFQANDLDETGRDRLSADSATIFASSLYGRVYAIDAKSGTQRWMAQIPGGTDRTSTFDPTVSNGAVYVGTWHETHPLTGGLAALDAATGEILWIHDFTPRSPELDSYCRSHPVVIESLVIASAADGRVYGLDRATGEPHWVAPAIEGYAYDDLRWLALAKGTVIISSMTGNATGLDPTTGALKWSTYIHGGALLGDIATDGDIAVFGLGEIVALDVGTGAILWRTGEGKQGGGYWGQPSIDGPRVYASRKDGFVALRAR